MAKADTTPPAPEEPTAPPAPEPPVDPTPGPEPEVVEEEVVLDRKEQLAADLPVQRSGLTSPSHDELNPGFALKTN